MSDGQATPRGTSSSGPSGSLTEKRLGDPDAANPPLKIALPTPVAPVILGKEFSKLAVEDDDDRSVRARRPSVSRAGANAATLSPAAGIAAEERESRSTTPMPITKKETKRSSSKQPVRRNSQAGYEGGVERHGQANDFVDEDDEASTDDDSKRPTPRRPEVNVAKFPDLARGHNRNRNPSASSHQHPGRLPLHAKPASRHSTGGFKSQQSQPSRRASSITSTRSAEANQHPFPTPGLKLGPDGIADEWQSTEEARLDEDGRKEKHWKRWGPYVSERQWVCLFSFCVTLWYLSLMQSSLGHGQRGLLGQRRCLDPLSP